MNEEICLRLRRSKEVKGKVKVKIGGRLVACSV